jgi:hypothetical protein
MVAVTGRLETPDVVSYKHASRTRLRRSTAQQVTYHVFTFHVSRITSL